MHMQAITAIFLFKSELPCDKDSQTEEIKEPTTRKYLQDMLLSTKSKIQKSVYGMIPFV